MFGSVSSLEPADWSGGETVDLRLTHGGTAMTNDVIPRSTIEPAGDITASITYGFTETPRLTTLNPITSSVSYGFTETPRLTTLNPITSSVSYGFTETPDLTAAAVSIFLPIFRKKTNILLRM